MSGTPELELLRTRLHEACDGDDRRLFVLLDEARVHGARGFLRETACPFVGLYRGTPAKDLAHVAPYLAQMPLSSLLLPWLAVDPKVAASAIVLVADADLEALRTHFRRWLIVQDSEGGEHFFRFYDPRVIAPFLEACTAAEAARFFGPIRTLLVCAQVPPVKEPLFHIRRPPEVSDVPLPPSAFDKFVLRQEHEAAFAAATLARYEKRSIVYLRSQHHERLADKSDDEVRGFVTQARQLGDQLGMPAGRDVTILAQVLVMGGTPTDIQEAAGKAKGDRIANIITLRDRLLAV